MGCAIAFSVIMLVGMIIRSKDIGDFGTHLVIFVFANLLALQGTGAIIDEDTGCFGKLIGLFFIALSLMYLVPLVIFVVTGHWLPYMLEMFPELVR